MLRHRKFKAPQAMACGQAAQNHVGGECIGRYRVKEPAERFHPHQPIGGVHVPDAASSIDGTDAQPRDSADGFPGPSLRTSGAPTDQEVGPATAIPQFRKVSGTHFVIGVDLENPIEPVRRRFPVTLENGRTMSPIRFVVDADARNPVGDRLHDGQRIVPAPVVVGADFPVEVQCIQGHRPLFQHGADGILLVVHRHHHAKPLLDHRMPFPFP